MKYNLDVNLKKISSKVPLSRRVGAYIIDLLIVYFIFFNIFFSVSAYFLDITQEQMEICAEDPTAGTCERVGMFATYSLIAGLLILWFYLGLQEAYLGKTFGESLLGLRVDKKINLKTALFRNLTKSIFIVLLPLDIFPIFKLNLRWTEIITKTKLIYEPNPLNIYRKLVD